MKLENKACINQFFLNKISLRSLPTGEKGYDVEFIKKIW